MRGFDEAVTIDENRVGLRNLASAFRDFAPISSMPNHIDELAEVNRRVWLRGLKTRVRACKVAFLVFYVAFRVCKTRLRSCDFGVVGLRNSETRLAGAHAGLR